MKVRVIGTTLALSLLLPAVLLLAHTADDPKIKFLLAGKKGLNIGEVQVWNDDVNLYVQIVMSDDTDQHLAETLVHVTLENDHDPVFPRNKKGQLVPGHFLSADPNPATPLVHLHTIPLLDEWKQGERMAIAVHVATEEGETAWSDGCVIEGTKWAKWFGYQYHIHP